MSICGSINCDCEKKCLCGHDCGTHYVGARLPETSDDTPLGCVLCGCPAFQGLVAPAFDPVADIAAFHEKFSLKYAGKPRALPEELAGFRARFLEEELEEYREASGLIAAWGSATPSMLEKQLDALVDLVYVALGTAYLHGFDFREAWRRVHEANMRKVRAERAEQSKRGTAYDVVKPPGWVAPSHRDLVEDHE